jgi:DNA-binding response OmpR family regulator
MDVPRILVIDDEEGMRSFIRKGLQAEGHTVREAADGPSGLAAALTGDNDLVILDLGLPKLDGTDILEQIHEHAPDLPVVVVTARDGVNDRVDALDSGAVDYVIKPFALAELAARVRVRLPGLNGGSSRSATGFGRATVVTYGRFTLHVSLRTIEIGSDSVILTPLETSLAEQFLLHGGQVLSREQLLRTVWGVDEAPRRSNLVEVAVVNLRRRMGPDAIETVRGLGYRLVG